ncbi:probable glucan 1,3-beta-glucosidase A [Tanacetum coccineum]
MHSFLSQSKEDNDGAALQFKSMTTARYLSAEHGGGSIIVANRTSAKSWETFKLWRINGTSFHIRVFNKRFLGLDSNGVNLLGFKYLGGNKMESIKPLWFNQVRLWDDAENQKNPLRVFINRWEGEQRKPNNLCEVFRVVSHME